MGSCVSEWFGNPPSVIVVLQSKKCLLGRQRVRILIRTTIISPLEFSWAAVLELVHEKRQRHPVLRTLLRVEVAAGGRTTPAV